MPWHYLGAFPFGSYTDLQQIRAGPFPTSAAAWLRIAARVVVWIMNPPTLVLPPLSLIYRRAKAGLHKGKPQSLVPKRTPCLPLTGTFWASSKPASACSSPCIYPQVQLVSMLATPGGGILLECSNVWIRCACGGSSGGQKWSRAHKINDYDYYDKHVQRPLHCTHWY